MSNVYVLSRESIQIDESSTWHVQGVYSTLEKAQEHAKAHIKPVETLGTAMNLWARHDSHGPCWNTHLAPPQSQWCIEEFPLDGYKPEPQAKQSDRQAEADW